MNPHECTFGANELTCTAISVPPWMTQVSIAKPSTISFISHKRPNLVKRDNLNPSVVERIDHNSISLDLIVPGLITPRAKIQSNPRVSPRVIYVFSDTLKNSCRRTLANKSQLRGITAGFPRSAKTGGKAETRQKKSARGTEARARRKEGGRGR